MGLSFGSLFTSLPAYQAVVFMTLDVFHLTSRYVLAARMPSLCIVCYPLYVRLRLSTDAMLYVFQQKRAIPSGNLTLYGPAGIIRIIAATLGRPISPRRWATTIPVLGITASAS